MKACVHHQTEKHHHTDCGTPINTRALPRLEGYEEVELSEVTANVDEVTCEKCAIEIPNIQRLQALPFKVKEKFVDLATDLSPENLNCDGEISQKQVAVRYARIMSDWRELEREHDVTAREDQVWAYLYEESDSTGD